MHLNCKTVCLISVAADYILPFTSEKDADSGAKVALLSRGVHLRSLGTPRR